MASKPFVEVPREGFASLGSLVFIVVRGILCGPVLTLFCAIFSVVCRGHCCMGCCTAISQSGGGHVVEFAVPIPKSGLRGIVAGAHSTLWFTELARNIGRIIIGQASTT